MSEEFIYHSNDYDRASQRFIIPLYIKDELGGYSFSSTGTLAKYNGHHYIIFAAHALAGNIDFNRVYTFSTGGDFFRIRDHAIGHAIYDEDDIVIVDYFASAFDGKNYFNINLSDMDGFEEKYFSWTGFPASMSDTTAIHRSKSRETLKEKYVFTKESFDYFANARYFTIISEIKSSNEAEITGHYDRKNVNLRYAGQRSMGPRPAGMSGGAMYFFAKGQILNDNLDDTFRFAGIGIEYKKDNTIVGVSRAKIINLIERFDRENPIRIVLV